jgi:hypothetical protein
MLAKDMPTDEEVNDPSFLAWLASACAAGRDVGSLTMLEKHTPPGRAYAAALEGLRNSLPMSQYAGRFIQQ